MKQFANFSWNFFAPLTIIWRPKYKDRSLALVEFHFSITGLRIKHEWNSLTIAIQLPQCIKKKFSKLFLENLLIQNFFTNLTSIC